MIQENLKNESNDLKGLKNESERMLICAWKKGYVAGFNDGYATMREADKALKNERPQGEWQEWIDERWGGATIYCPYCHEDALENNKEGTHRQVKSNYCPNCGADMREADNDKV